MALGSYLLLPPTHPYFMGYLELSDSPIFISSHHKSGTVVPTKDVVKHLLGVKSVRFQILETRQLKLIQGVIEILYTGS